MHRSNVYRAIVEEANPSTGLISVSIPGIAGAGSRFTVTSLGRTGVEGTWKMPPVGSVVLVAAEDENLTTLFLVQTYTYDTVVRTTDVYGDFHGPVVVVARNDEATTIPKGTVVYDSADGDNLVIGVADADDTGKMPILGVTVEDIAPNEYGKVAVSGFLEGINTSGLSAGVDIYASTDGDLTTNPASLAVAQIVGKVVEVGTEGSMIINVYPPGVSTGSGNNYNGIFSGTIYASGGVIGGTTEGWVIQPGQLESHGSGAKIVLDGRDGEIYVGTGASNNANTPFYVSKDGVMSLGEGLVWDGTDLRIDGSVTSTSGSIGNWRIDNTSLNSGTGASYVGLASSGTHAIWAGASAPAGASFSVTPTGIVKATNASITGNINATSGSIGGWQISGNTLQSSGTSKIVLDGQTTSGSIDAKIYIGNENWGNSSNGVYVDNTGRFGLGSNLTWDPTASSAGTLFINGRVDANTANFAGWKLTQGRLYAGTEGDYVELNSESTQEYRTWAGHPTAASAPFRVRRDGAVTASSATVNLWDTNQVRGRLVIPNNGASVFLGASVSGSNNGLWINNNNYWYDTGQFRVGDSTNYVDFSNGSLAVASNSANITGGSISIGGSSGFNVDTTGTVRVGPSSGNALYISNIGAVNIGTAVGSGNFRLASNGSVNIGGVAGLYVDTNGALWTNNAASGSAAFLVDGSGNVRIGSSDSSALHVRSLAASVAGSAGMLYVGTASDSTTNFRITKAGQVDIGSSAASVGAANTLHISPEGNLWAGGDYTTSGSTNALFILRNNGSIRIGGNDPTSLNIETSGNVYAGSSTFASAPFSLSASTGGLYASNASINSVYVRGNIYAQNSAGTAIDGLSIVGDVSVSNYKVKGNFGTVSSFSLDAVNGFSASTGSSISTVSNSFLSIGANGFKSPSGTTAGPGYAFTASNGTGLSFDGSGTSTLSISVIGEKALSLTTANARFFDGATEMLKVDSAGTKILNDGTYSFLGDTTTGMTNSAGDGTLTFKVNNQSALTVNSHGVGNTLEGYRSTSASTDIIFLLKSDHISVERNQFRVFGNGDTQNRNNSYLGWSDGTLKENIQTARSYLNELRQLRAVTFTWKDDEDQTKYLGLVAQEVQTVFPRLVHADGDGVLAVKYSILVPMLLTAVQELTNRIEALEGE